MKNIHKKAGIIASLALAAGLGFPAQAEDLVIGSVMPLTGALQAYGPGIINGSKLAIAEANEAGGVMGKTVVLKNNDSQSTPQASIDAAKKLISVDGAVGILGPAASGNTSAVATAVTAVDSVPHLSPSATAPVLTNLADNDFLFRTTPSDAYQGIALAALAQDKGARKVAVIYVNNDYGEGLANSFNAAFSSTGGSVAASVAYEPKAPSYRGELAKLADSGAESLVVIAYPDDGGINILKQSLEEGFFTKFIFPDGMKSETMIPAIGAGYLDGMYGTAPKSVENKGSEAFNNNYTKMFGEKPPHAFINNNYDAAMILMLAIEKAGSTDGVAVRDALREVANAPGEMVGPGEFAKAKALLSAGKDINYVGAAGEQNFDDNGDVAGTFEHWEIKDGAIVTVKIF